METHLFILLQSLVLRLCFETIATAYPIKHLNWKQERKSFVSFIIITIIIINYYYWLFSRQGLTKYVALAGNHYVYQISLELLEIHLLHLPSAGIKGVHHYTRLRKFSLFTGCSFSCCESNTIPHHSFSMWLLPGKKGIFRSDV